MGAGKHDRVAIRIAQPAFPVGVLAAMARFDDLGFHLVGTRNNSIEVVQFKPEENAVSVWSKVGISERAMMMLDVPVVQLEDELSARDQPFIIRSAVAALTAKETLIPATARLDVMHANERL